MRRRRSDVLRPADLSTGVRRCVGALRLLVLASLVAYAVSVVPGVRTKPGYSRLWDVGVYGAVFVGSALLCALRGVLVVHRRSVWLALGIGMTLYAGGTLYYYLVLARMTTVPYPSLADLLWLSFYPCAYFAVFRLLLSQTSRVSAGAWLDGLVGGLGAAALLAAFAFATIVTRTGGSPAAVATNLAYPVADLLLLAVVVVALTVLGRRAGRAWVLLGAGLLGFAAADTTLLFLIARNSYRPGGPLDAAWAVAEVCLAFAAWAPSPDRVVEVGGSPRLAVPALCTATSLGLLVYATARPLSWVPISLSATCLVVSAVRTGVAFREMRSLLDARRLARTDDLTGLPNRRHFLERLHASAVRDPGAEFAVLVLDLDRFKEINDSLGHQAGDQLLQQIGSRLAGALRNGDVLARLGGDEFAVLLVPADEQQATRFAEQIRVELQRPVRLGHVRMHVEASIGIVISRDAVIDVAALLQHADIAMNRAKTTHSRCAVFDREVDGSASDRLQMVEELRTALKSDQLVLHYQPKLDLRLARVTTVEALVRWQHPTRGPLDPDAFLLLAEQAGLMRQLTTTVLGLALRQVKQFHRDGLPLGVAVNISPANLLDSELPAQVSDLLARHDLPATVLELEITEQSMVSDDHRAREVLHRLKTLGVKISIDDYGKGFSSLSYLQDLPIDELKIDKSFMAGLTSDPRVAAIVRSTISLAHALDLQVVAEGIEDAETLELLVACGCDIGQGYYIGRPMTAAALRTALSAAADNDTPAHLVPPAQRNPIGTSPAARG